MLHKGHTKNLEMDFGMDFFAFEKGARTSLELEKRGQEPFLSLKRGE